jgi:hypothetical protein
MHHAIATHLGSTAPVVEHRGGMHPNGLVWALETSGTSHSAYRLVKAATLKESVSASGATAPRWQVRCKYRVRVDLHENK